jgi:DnaJ-class molecular chaperone
MPFSESRYVRCPECFGDGEVLEAVSEGVIDYVKCPVCNGDKKILDEQIPEEDER